MHKSKSDQRCDNRYSLEYEKLMTELFPKLLSYSPTGVNYDMNVPVEERVKRWFELNKEITDFCNSIERSYVGRYSPIPIDYIERATHLAGPSCLRNLRKRWKEEMNGMGWPLCDAWVRPSTASCTSISRPLWYEFRDAVMSYKESFSN